MNFTSYDFFYEGEQRPSNADYFQTVQNKSLNTEKLYYFTKIEQKIKKICKHDDKKIYIDFNETITIVVNYKQNP